jgi:glutaredoxin
MKELIFFKSPDCEYCRMAEKYLNQTIRSNPEYQEIPLQIVDEDADVDFSMKYDYDFVPAFFVGGVKVHEGITTRGQIEAILSEALGR